MKFCPVCESKMTKSTVTGTVQYVCRCQTSIPGTPEDTLMSEELSTNSNIKYEDFINNAVHDLAGNRKAKECHNCGLPFLIMIRVGVSEQVLYVCKNCEVKITHEEYMKEK